MRLFAGLVASLAFVPAACAQGDPAVFRADARLVVLHATVVDRSGNLLTDLPRTAFHTYEDGVEQDLKVFRREDVPVSLGVIIDNSGSMKGKRARVEAAARNLVAASNPEDEVFVINFNDDVYRDVDLTGDLKKIAQGLARIDSRGGTAMRDAIQAGVLYAKAKGRHDKRVLVVVTDGDDNMSETSLEAVIREAQQRELLIYAIGLLSEEEHEAVKRAHQALDAITKATGGLVWYPKEVDEVSRIAVQVAHDIRNQYILAYSPKNTALDGHYRQIKVSANGPNHPTVRTRTGYYATADLGTRPAVPQSVIKR